MALPPGIQAKTVQLGIASFADGTLATGRATISLGVNVLHTPSNRPIFSSDITKPFVDGMVSFDLLPTDAPGLNRVDFSYTLRVEIQGANVQPDVLHFLLPTAGPDTVDLDGLVTVPSSAGVPISVDVATKADLAALGSTGLPTPGAFTYFPDGTVKTDPDGNSYTWNTDGTPKTQTRAGTTRTFTWNTDGTLASVS